MVHWKVTRGFLPLVLDLHILSALMKVELLSLFSVIASQDCFLFLNLTICVKSIQACIQADDDNELDIR